VKKNNKPDKMRTAEAEFAAEITPDGALFPASGRHVDRSSENHQSPERNMNPKKSNKAKK
jgi:hypothetical protein